MKTKIIISDHAKVIYPHIGDIIEVSNTHLSDSIFVQMYSFFAEEVNKPEEFPILSSSTVAIFHIKKLHPCQ